jgi:hypothetical protein
MPKFSIQFCTDLFQLSKTIAQERLSAEPTNIQLQMIDLLKAFHDLKKDKYSKDYGFVSDDRDAAQDIIRNFCIAMKATPPIPPMVSIPLAHAISTWIQIHDLSQDLQENFQRCSIVALELHAKVRKKVDHFFNEMHLHSSSLSTSEKDGISWLAIRFQSEMAKACDGANFSLLESLFDQLSISLAQLEAPSTSHVLKTFCTKTQHDLANCRLLATGQKYD